MEEDNAAIVIFHVIRVPFVHRNFAPATREGVHEFASELWDRYEPPKGTSSFVSVSNKAHLPSQTAWTTIRYRTRLSRRTGPSPRHGSRPLDVPSNQRCRWPINM